MTTKTYELMGALKAIKFLMTSDYAKETIDEVVSEIESKDVEIKNARNLAYLVGYEDGRSNKPCDYSKLED